MRARATRMPLAMRRSERRRSSDFARHLHARRALFLQSFHHVLHYHAEIIELVAGEELAHFREELLLLLFGVLEHLLLEDRDLRVELFILRVTLHRVRDQPLDAEMFLDGLAQELFSLLGLSRRIEM